MAIGILVEAALSFLGVGVRPPTPSLGLMLSDGRGFMIQAPWMVVFPGLAIMLAVLGFNMLADGLRDWLDPQQASGR
jgi:ABC-type dipeptide/oligopeptide/nickel transport system permease subunit